MPSDADSSILCDHKATQRSIIDQEIAELEAKIQVLREKRNQLAPISSLSPDVLTRIFTHLQSTQPKYLPYEWIVVTHVSRNWRAISLGTGALWRRIITSESPGSQVPVAWPLTCLERSGTCKLDVGPIKCDDSSSNLAFLFLILEHLSRIRTLRLFVNGSLGAGSRSLQTMAGFFRNPAPVLEEFTIEGNIFSLCEQEDHSFYHNFSWFNGVSPNLRCFILNHPPADLIALRCQNLTCLELRSFVGSATPRVSISTLLNLLSDTKKLQRIVLEYTFTVDKGTPLQQNRISLEHLQYSKLSLHPHNLLQFLAAVSVPSTSETVIQVPVKMNQQDIILAMMSYFSGGIRSASCFECTFHDDAVDWKMHALCLPSDTEAKEHCLITLSLPQGWQASFSVLDLLPFSRLQELSLIDRSVINIDWPTSSQIFASFSRLENLKTLSVQKVFLGSFLSFVKGNIQTFGALTTLTISLGKEPGEPVYEDDECWFLDKLMNILERRAGLAVPLRLEKLFLVDFQASYEVRERVKSFRALGVQVGEDNQS